MVSSLPVNRAIAALTWGSKRCPSGSPVRSRGDLDTSFIVKDYISTCFAKCPTWWLRLQAGADFGGLWTGGIGVQAEGLCPMTTGVLGVARIVQGIGQAEMRGRLFGADFRRSRDSEG